MIINKSPLLPIIHLDDEDTWDSLQKHCSGFLDLAGLSRLKNALEDNTQSIVIEHHYIDKDYRDTFSNFHSKRFSTPNSRCIRLHFFSSLVDVEDLKHVDRIQNHYLGYSVIRPTRPNCIGRTLLDLKNYIGLDAYVCSCKEKINLKGTELEVEGFPFISQDADATVCAQSSLWMITTYFSNRYSLYSESYPSQISNLVQDYAIGSRIAPSDGLYTWQLAETLRRLRFHPVTYSKEGFGVDAFYQILYTYIESGIPVLATTSEHVVVLNGHSLDKTAFSQIRDNIFSTSFCNGVTFNDDNVMPYQNTSANKESSISLSQVEEIIVPLAEKVFLTAENFEKVVLQVLSNPRTGISQHSPLLTQSPVIKRMYLTTVQSYKKKLSERKMGNMLVESIYRDLSLPHFIWLCELSTQAEYKEEKIVGEIIWDATRNVWETDGWIAIHYPEKLFIDIGSALNSSQEIHAFNLTESISYPLYKSNLKQI